MSELKTFRIRGVEIQVTDQEINEQMTVVCSLKEGNVSPFDDNLEAPCDHCQRMVIFRPYMKEAGTKLCIECGMAAATAQRH